MVLKKVFPIKKIGCRNYIDREDIDKAMAEATQWG